MMLAVPFDAAMAASERARNNRIAWPISPTFASDAYRATLARFLILASNLSTDQRDAAYLGGAALGVIAVEMLEAALCVQYGDARGIAPYGDSPLLTYFGTKDSSPEQLPFTAVKPGPVSAPRIPTLTSLRVTARWESPVRLIRTVFGGGPAVISLNDLVRETIQLRPARYVYRDAGGILARGRRGAFSKTDIEPELAAAVAGALADSPALDEFRRQKLRAALLPLAEKFMARASADLHALSSLPHLPSKVLSGTGAKYASRAVGLASLRRGGEVLRCAHSVTLGLLDAPELAAASELCVSSSFIMATPRLAGALERSKAGELLPPGRRAEIHGLAGDPKIRKLPLLRRRRPASRPTVVYAPTMIRAVARHAFSTLAPIVYLDWQLRLARKLSRLPLRLICKPHPEGVFQNKRHPLEDIAETVYVPFEQVIENADIFIFDRPISTTFGEALCTDRPIIYIDLGPPDFTAEIKPLIDRRCRVIPATYGGDNVPHVDERQLADAFRDLHDIVEPLDFADMIIGHSNRSAVRAN